MSTIDRLLQHSKPIWDKILQHPFVLGIRDGSLDPEQFRQYLMQDYRYLREYARVFAIGTAKGQTIEEMQLFSSYLPILLDGEMTIHQGYLRDFGLSEKAMEETIPLFANRSYTAYMIKCAYEGTTNEILTAILPCALTYHAIAETMVQTKPDCINHPFYGIWIRRYLDPHFSERNHILVDYLNKNTAHATPHQLSKLEEIFAACSEYELHFWHMANRLPAESV